MRDPKQAGPEVAGHIVTVKITSGQSPWGRRGELLRKALTDREYRQMLEAQRDGEVKIHAHSRVRGGPARRKALGKYTD